MIPSSWGQLSVRMPKEARESVVKGVVSLCLDVAAALFILAWDVVVQQSATFVSEALARTYRRSVRAFKGFL